MSFRNEEASANKAEISEEFLSSGNIKQIKEKEVNTIKLFKFRDIKVNKPLIYLKIAQCLWFTSALGLVTFLSVFFKQRGISIKELFFMYALAPVVQYFCILLFGLLSDKLGRSKPIVIFNLLVSMALAAVFIILPSMSTTQRKAISFECDRESLLHNISVDISCSNIGDSFFAKYCNSSYLEEQDVDCGLVYSFGRAFSYWGTKNTSFLPDLNDSRDKNCTHDTFVIENKKLRSICDENSNISCKMKCEISNTYQSSWMFKYRNALVVCYMIVQFIFNLTYGNVFRFLDILAMTLIKEHSSNLGHARFWCALGAVFGPLLTSFAVQSSSSPEGIANYDTIFYVYIALNSITLTVIFQMKVSTLEHGQDFWNKVIVLIRKPDVLVLIVILLVTGGGWGFMLMFKGWYLDDLGAGSYVIGLQGTIENLSALPFLFVSKWYINTFGYSNIFIFALVSRATASFIYSFLKIAWPAILLSILDLFSYNLFWVCVLNYCHDMAPKGFTSTVLAVAGATHFTIGRITGSVVGGAAASTWGGRTAFRVMGYMCVGTALLYITYLVIKKICRKYQDQETYNKQRIAQI